MKTTIELPDDLMKSAKVAAARRRVSLKQLFTQALRKELSGASCPSVESFRVDEDGIPYLPADKERVSSADIARLNEETDVAPMLTKSCC